MTVLVADVVVFFSAVLYYTGPRGPPARRGGATFPMRAGLAALLLLLPPLVLIDHGHFQYNSTALGLALWGIALVDTHPCIASVAYVCAFLYKQTLLAFAPAFFAVLLGRSLTEWHVAGEGRAVERRWASPVRALARVAALGVTVLGTVTVTLPPYLWSAEPTVDGVVVSRSDRLVALWRRVFPS